MPLFTERERIDTGPARYAEPSYAYYDRSARPEIGRIRVLLERWFDEYPPAHQAELRRRFDVEFDSAFFELFLHALLHSLGYAVTVHPDLGPSVAGYPDFLAERDNCRFVLEATVSTDESDQARGRRRMEETLLDGINRLESPNFMLSLVVHRISGDMPSSRRIRRFLTNKLQDLDPEEVAHLYEDGGWEALPTFVYSNERAHLVFRPIPIKEDRRGDVERPIGTLGPGNVRVIDPKAALRQSITRKATAYGELDLPFVIAVNSLAEYLPGHREAIDALFGDPSLQVAVGRDFERAEPRLRRTPDGVWTSPSGPRNSRVSAVLFSLPVIPWNLEHVPLLYVPNPWAYTPDCSDLAQFTHVEYEDRDLKVVDGRSTGTIFRLAPDWPHGDEVAD